MPTHKHKHTPRKSDSPPINRLDSLEAGEDHHCHKHEHHDDEELIVSTEGSKLFEKDQIMFMPTYQSSSRKQRKRGYLTEKSHM